MRLCLTIWIAFALVACSENPERSTAEHIREATDISCPIHDVPVFKMAAAGAVSCGPWDPTLGLTVDELRQRFPYAIWDSNIFQVDETPDAKIPRYNLVCDRCIASWNEYGIANSPRNQNQRLEITVTGSGEIMIHDSQFTVEQIAAIAKVVSDYNPDSGVHLRADKSVSTDVIKAIVQACGEGGLTDFIFGAFVDEHQGAPNSARTVAE